MGAVKFKGTKLDPATIKALVSGTLVNGSKPSVWWARQSQAFRDQFMDTMRTSMRNGESLAQAATRVFGGTVDGVVTPGIMKGTKAQASALAATSISAVTNEAALASFKANADVIKAFAQLSTLDNKTSDICIAYSGQMWDIDTLQPIPPSYLPFNGGPPRHFNCRSRLRPVTKSFRELGLDVDEIPASTRASMDGQIPADITFNQFLKGKPPSFADDLLGPKRAQLWRDGEINLTQLVDMRGNPMTLAQLEAKVGIKPPPKFNPATNKTVNVVTPKPKTVNSFLENDDGSFVQITQAQYDEIRNGAKRLVAAADEADELVTSQIKALADDVGAAFPDAAITKNGPLVDEGSLFWRKKDLESTSRKIQTYARDRGITFTEATNAISDSLRYTYIVDEADYIAAVRATMQRFAELGYKNGKFDAAWFKRPDYRGLNINMISPQGVKMELQFHTAKSFEIKNGINHELYEKFRKLSTAKQNGKEGQLLQAQMKANADTIPFPPNIKELDELAKIYNSPNPAAQAKILDDAAGKVASVDNADLEFFRTTEFNNAVSASLTEGKFAEALQTINAATDISDTVKKSAVARVEQVRKESEKKADSLIAEKKFADIKTKDDFNLAHIDLISDMNDQNIDLSVRLQVTAKLKELKKAKLEDFAEEDVVFHQLLGNFKEALAAAKEIKDPSPAFKKLIAEVKRDQIASTEKKVRALLKDGNSDDAIKELLKFGDADGAPTIQALHKEIQKGTKLVGDKVTAIENYVPVDMDDFTKFVQSQINTDDVPNWVWKKILNDPDFAIAEENAKWIAQVKNINKQLLEGKVDDALLGVKALPDTIFDKQKLKFAVESAKKKKDDIIKVEFPKKVEDIAVKEFGFKASDLDLLMTSVDDLGVLLDGVVTEQFKVGLRKQLGEARLKMRAAIDDITKINKASKGEDALDDFANALDIKFSSHPEFKEALLKVKKQAKKKASTARMEVINAMIKAGDIDADDIIKFGDNILKDAMKDVTKKLGVAQKQAKIIEVKAKIAQAKNGNVNITNFVEDVTEYDAVVDKVLGIHTKAQLDDAVALFKIDANSQAARSKLFDTLGNASTDAERRAIKEYVHKRVNPKTLPNGMNFDEVVAQIVSKHVNNAPASEIQAFMKAMVKGGNDDLRINFEQTVFTRANVKNIDALGVTPEGEATPAVQRIIAELKAKGDRGDVPIPEHTADEILQGAKHWLNAKNQSDSEFKQQVLSRSKSIIKQGAGHIRRGDQIFGKNSWGITEEAWEKWVKEVAPTLSEWDVALMSQYTGGMAGSINAGLYNGGVQFANTAGARALNAALAKMPKHTGTVYRGTNTRSDWTADYIDARYQVGETVIERGFGSSATQESASFNGILRFVIKTKGKQGAIMGHLGGYGAKEMEVLFGAGSKFRVLRKKRSGSQGITVWMEEI